MSNIPLQLWIEWRLTCALALCSEGTQVELRAFVNRRFAGYVHAVDISAGLPAAHDDEMPDAWALFEGKMLSDRRRDGRVYKIWLFDRLANRTASDIDTIESGVSMRLRDWAKQWWTKMRRPLLRTRSLDEDPSLQTAESLLRDVVTPRDEAVLNECKRAAEVLASELFRLLSNRERLTAAASLSGLKLSNPAVEKASGCKRTMLYEAFETFSDKFRAHLTAEYPDESPRTLALLKELYAHTLGDLVLEWCGSEKSCEAFFNIIRKEIDHGKIANI